MKQRITIYAEGGMILTDGEHYGTIIHLAVDSDISLWKEITEAEYQKIIKEQETSNTEE